MKLFCELCDNIHSHMSLLRCGITRHGNKLGWKRAEDLFDQPLYCPTLLRNITITDIQVKATRTIAQLRSLSN